MSGCKALSRDIPAEWLDRLLLVVAEQPIDATVEEAVMRVLSVAADLLHGVTLGAVLPEHEHVAVVCLAPPLSSRLAEAPRRLFPDLAHERIFAVAGLGGPTLHVAADDDARLTDGGMLDVLLDRLAVVLGQAVRMARAETTLRACATTIVSLEAQVIQSDKLASLGQIAAGVVHELNNPLTSIIAYSDYLRRKAERDGADGGDVERLLRIQQAADRILGFSRDLITYARPSEGVPVPVSVHSILDRALAFCEHVLDESSVLVEKSFVAADVVQGDGGQLTQVFVNLFTNAAHAMRETGGMLTVVTESAGDRVTVLVSDQGHGIDAEHLPRIFDPFFTTKTDGTGTGLGLNIVRNIVVAHGGRIRAEAQAPQGTVFSIDLPLLERD